MGWTFSNDQFSVNHDGFTFEDLEDAVDFCHILGVAYEVSYPHFRYFVKKSYADNFKWKGPPKEEEDIA